MTRTPTPALSELTGRRAGWIAGGLVMTLATMPGQTNFIAQFNAVLRAEFGLSSGLFGGLYTLATLTSATGLIFAGALADRIAPRKLALAIMAGLAATALLMSRAQNLPLLVVALALLRFFGQGMLMHVALTAMARWFDRFRGRALSFAMFGMTLGDSLLPFTLTVSIAAFGWRTVWIGTACALALVLMPLVFLLLRRSPEGGAVPAGGPAPAATGLEWRRARVLRDPLFWAILPGIMAMPGIGTLFIFHQANLVEAKGWDLTTFTAFFPVLAMTVAAASLAAGVLVDRLGAWRLMPVLLLPLALACLALATVTEAWSIPLVFLGFGLTQGVMNPVMGAVWVELYGTAHIGAIRSLATAALVAASALGPGLAGWLIDRGLPLERQAVGYAAFCLACATGYAFLQPRIRRRAMDGSRA
ncbi:MFS transporter (plasmid) [Cereibacter sphaeroides]|uniref:MFS transporter n=1 Tax=Cereibacter sphaeroides TaxID=1063 RepID=UPI000F53BEFE|nr:MFS transporter [Cereibacter sphaeroides]AZB66419.1 MFS transporter [Cereibacter sphaeroides]AZB71259.1 MFS transporter [Cereibacter sphaeroides]